MSKPYKNDKKQPKLCCTKIMNYEISQQINPELLSKDAKQIANTFGAEYHLIDGQAHKIPLRDTDKPTQIRKFYDEVVKLNDRCKQDGFGTVELDIHMLIPKSAYAKGREHVSYNFDYFISQGVKQIKCKQSLQNFKLLFEAVLGFYKEIKPKD